MVLKRYRCSGCLKRWRKDYEVCPSCWTDTLTPEPVTYIRARAYDRTATPQAY